MLAGDLCAERCTHTAVLEIPASARNRPAERACQVVWFVEAVARFRPPHRFVLWRDRAVFHFLTDAPDRSDYIEVLMRALEPNGQVIMAAFANGGPTVCSGLRIVQYHAGKLAAEPGKEFELLAERGETRITPAGTEQQFGDFRFRRVNAAGRQ